MEGAALIGALIKWITSRRFALVFANWAAIGLTVLWFLLSLRRSGERARKIVERLENQEQEYEIQRMTLKAAARCPRNRDELAQRLRDGDF